MFEMKTAEVVAKVMATSEVEHMFNGIMIVLQNMIYDVMDFITVLF